MTWRRFWDAQHLLCYKIEVWINIFLRGVFNVFHLSKSSLFVYYARTVDVYLIILFDIWTLHMLRFYMPNLNDGPHSKYDNLNSRSPTLKGSSKLGGCFSILEWWFNKFSYCCKHARKVLSYFSLYTWLSSYYRYGNYDCGSNDILRFIYLHLDESKYNNSVSNILIEHHVAWRLNHKTSFIWRCVQIKSVTLDILYVWYWKCLCHVECCEDKQNEWIHMLSIT